jgi:hypothetical protein
MRTTAILSTVVLGASLVAGCGSSDGGSKASSDSYCGAVKAAKADFASFGSSTPDFDKFDSVLDTFHKLADKAPSEVSDDWKVLDDAFTTLEKDLGEAGLSLEDLGAISQGQVPEGMSQEDLTTLAPKLQETFAKLDDDKFKKASDAIEKHAKDECGINLADD